MSFDETQPYSDATPPPPPNSKRGLHWGLGLGCGCLATLFLMLILCGGGFAYFAYRMGMTLEDAWSGDPVVAAEATAELAEIELPGDYQPKGSFQYKIPMTDRKITWVVYEIGDQQGIMAMGNFGPLEVKPDEVVHRFEQVLMQQPEFSKHKDLPEKTVIEATETREMMIRAQPATFLFTKGHSTEDDDEAFRQVAGSFQGQGGPVLFFIHLEEDAYDEDEILGILESIK